MHFFFFFFLGGGGSSYKWTILWGHSMLLRVFSKGQGTKWGTLFGLVNFQKNFGVLEIPDFFFFSFFFSGGGGGG